MYLAPPADCLQVTAATTAQANLAKSLFLFRSLDRQSERRAFKKKKQQKPSSCLYYASSAALKLNNTYRALGERAAPPRPNHRLTQLFHLRKKRLLQMSVQTYRLEGRAVVEKKKKKLHAAWPVVVLFSERRAEEG